jgi:invasion protein IalB
MASTPQATRRQRALAAAAVLLACAAAQSAAAQPPEERITPTPWMKRCNKGTAAEPKPFCVTARDLRNEVGITVTTLTVLERHGDARSTLRVGLTPDLRLADGTRLTLDQEALVAAPYLYCIGFCYLEHDLDTEGLTRLKKARVLGIEATHVNGTSINRTVSLVGFAEVEAERLPPPLITATVPINAEKPTASFPWSRLCGTDLDNRTGQVCSTWKDARFENDGFQVAVALIERANSHRKTLRVFVPRGNRVDRDVRIGIGDAPVISAPYITCSFSGCFAGLDIAAETFARMNTATAVLVQAVDVKEQPLSMSVPLADFVQGHDGPPVEVAIYEPEWRKRGSGFMRKDDLGKLLNIAF